MNRHESTIQNLAFFFFTGKFLPVYNATLCIDWCAVHIEWFIQCMILIQDKLFLCFYLGERQSRPCGIFMAGVTDEKPPDKSHPVKSPPVTGGFSPGGFCQGAFHLEPWQDMSPFNPLINYWMHKLHVVYLWIGLPWVAFEWSAQTLPLTHR